MISWGVSRPKDKEDAGFPKLKSAANGQQVKTFIGPKAMNFRKIFPGLILATKSNTSFIKNYPWEPSGVRGEIIYFINYQLVTLIFGFGMWFAGIFRGSLSGSLPKIKIRDNPID